MKRYGRKVLGLRGKQPDVYETVKLNKKYRHPIKDLLKRSQKLKDDELKKILSKSNAIRIQKKSGLRPMSKNAYLEDDDCDEEKVEYVPEKNDKIDQMFAQAFNNSDFK